MNNPAPRHVLFYYPSGNEVRAWGMFRGLITIGEGKETGLVLEVTEDVVVGDKSLKAGHVMVADPRCACVDIASGDVLYNPRQHVHRLNRDFRKWLHGNRDWPRRLGIKNLD